MKKNTEPHKSRWIKAKRRRRKITLRRRNVICKVKGDNIGEKIITPPTQISFSKNTKETLTFFRELREMISGSGTSKRVDISNIKEISIPSAIVLSAELQRWQRVRNIKLRPWREKVGMRAQNVYSRSLGLTSF